jgi:hypothetical protein
VFISGGATTLCAALEWNSIASAKNEQRRAESGSRVKGDRLEMVKKRIFFVVRRPRQFKSNKP